MAETPPPVQVESTNRSFWSRLSIVWIIPLIALLAALGVAWQSYSQRGPVIEVTFENGAGIAARETELRYRDITVGTVEDVTFGPGLQAVIVSIRVDKSVADYIDAAATFWVVRPELTTQGISGLDTVLSGVYIEGSWDGEVGTETTHFKGLPNPPLFRTGQEGLQIALRTTPGGDLTDNSPITYRGIEVGRVGKAHISQEGNFAIAEAIIFQDHVNLISSSTRFWNTAGFSFSVGPQGANIDFSSLATLIAGGITFDTFVSGGEPVTDGHVFDIYAEEASARNSLFSPSEVETLKMRVIFDDNISGLAVDAPVELSGLKIGRVESVSGVIDQDAFGDNRVRLNALLAIQPARLGLQGEVSPDAALTFLTKQIKDGLRARLASASLLTGGLKIELVQEPDAPPATLRTVPDGAPIIPTTDSDISDAAATVEGVFNRVNSLPIEELLTSAIDFLDSAKALVSDEDWRGAPADVRLLLGDVRKIVNSDDVQEIPGNLNTAVARLESLMAQLEKEDFAARLLNAVDAAGEAATSVSSSVEGMPGLIDQIEALAAKAESLPLESLTTELNDLLASADDILSTDGAKKLPGNLNEAFSRLESLLARLEKEEFTARLAKAVDAVAQAAGSVSSSVEGMPALIEKIDLLAARADDLPLESLTAELNELLASADDILSSEGAKKLPADLGAALNELNATLTELREGGVVTNVNATLASARKAADAIAGSAQELPDLVARMERVLTQASATITGYNQGETLSRAARSALRDISKAADSLTSLARMLERNPSLLLRGR